MKMPYSTKMIGKYKIWYTCVLHCTMTSATAVNYNVIYRYMYSVQAFEWAKRARNQ